MKLPLVFRNIDNVDQAVETLRDAYFNTYQEFPKIEQINAWKSSLEKISLIASNYPIIVEYPIFSLERVDYLIVGKKKVLLIETKGWKHISKINDYRVNADGKITIDPCYQLINYLSKFKYFHSAASQFSLEGVLFLYNSREYSNDCNIAYSENELKEFIERLGGPGNDDDVNQIVNGRFTITDDLINFLQKNKGSILNQAAKVLLSRGYGLTEEQMMLVEKVLDSLKNKENKVYFVRGESGSGKTLVALTLLFEAVSRGYKALIGYKNNRFLWTLKTILNIKRSKISLASLVVFYSTGRKGNYSGIGEWNFPIEKYGNLDLIIFDEAQRMSENVIKTSMERARVLVYFYDEGQVLIGDEAGTRDNFIKYSGGRNYEELTLSAPIRVPKNYLEAVKALLLGKTFTISNFDFRIFDNITEMLEELKRRNTEGYKIALICSYTESKGDKRNPDSIENIRIGYPLPSGFDLYKGIGVTVKWLMKERTEYPKYWMGELNPLEYCASVYGAQGFEADYVGVVWGRDMVWRNNNWAVNPDVITDNVGMTYSLKNIAKRNKDRAIELLKNRYYIMLTRGIRGVYVFFEDEATKDFIKNLMR